MQAAILVNKSAEMQVTLDLGRAAGQLARWALRAATAAHLPQRTSQAWLCNGKLCIACLRGTWPTSKAEA